MPIGPRVLFVCLGNICRSPLAEAALRREAERSGFAVEVDSAGTGDWHVGEAPDPRAQAVAARHGIDIAAYRARQVTRDDFRRFTHVIALDTQNLAALIRLQPAEGGARLALLLDFVDGRGGEAVADPYFGDATGFDRTWADVTQGAAALLQALRSDARPA